LKSFTGKPERTDCIYTHSDTQIRKGQSWISRDIQYEQGKAKKNIQLDLFIFSFPIIHHRFAYFNSSLDTEREREKKSVFISSLLSHHHLFSSSFEPFHQLSPAYILGLD